MGRLHQESASGEECCAAGARHAARGASLVHQVGQDLRRLWAGALIEALAGARPWAGLRAATFRLASAAVVVPALEGQSAPSIWSAARNTQAESATYWWESV